jgi:pathogenesis-related protein 1
MNNPFTIKQALVVILMSLFVMTGVQAASKNSNNSVRLGKHDIKVLLAEHNRARADVRVKPLKWSNKIARFSGAWAERLAKKGCKIKHRPRGGKWQQQYGENLFIGTRSYYGLAEAVRAWESEKKDYKGGPVTRSNFRPIGHYTQMVWHNTTHVGCAQSFCRDLRIVVCNYDPPGNYLGQKPY